MSCLPASFWSQVRYGGHRGGGADGCPPPPGAFAARHALENSALSFRLAAATPALDFIEMDVQLTRDGVPIIHHDWCVRVDAQSHGAPAASVALRVPLPVLTLAQLQALAPQPYALRGSGSSSSSSSSIAGGLALGAAAVLDETAWALSAAGGASASAASGGAGATGSSATAAALPPPAQAAAAGRAAHARATSRALAALGIDTHHAAVAGRLARCELGDGQGLRALGAGAFPTLAAVLAHTFAHPTHPALNLELKYPSPAEAALHGLGGAAAREQYWGAVWAVVAALAGQRAIIFSSFDPQLCALARSAQRRYPVLFLTMAGVEVTPDPRCNSFEAALAYAAAEGLAGVVSHVSAVVGSSGGGGGGGVGAGGAEAAVAAAQGAVGRARAAGLLLGTFGGANNEAAVIAAQASAGVNLVILDHLKRVPTRG